MPVDKESYRGAARVEDLARIYKILNLNSFDPK